MAVVDLDVHHGDGTQLVCDRLNAQLHAGAGAGAAADGAQVLFLSLHRYDGGAYFPGTGHPGAVGAHALCLNLGFDTDPRGAGAHCRVMCDDTLRVAAEALVVPLLRDVFRPDAVLVSLGFDAAEGDPLGGMGVRAGLASLVRRLASLPSSRGVMCVLEGGYDVGIVAAGVRDVVLALGAADTGPITAVECLPPRRAWDRCRAAAAAAAAAIADAAAASPAADADASSGAAATAAPPPPALSDAAMSAANEAWTRDALRRLFVEYTAAAERLLADGGRATQTKECVPALIDWCRKQAVRV